MLNTGMIQMQGSSAIAVWRMQLAELQAMLEEMHRAACVREAQQQKQREEVLAVVAGMISGLRHSAPYS